MESLPQPANASWHFETVASLPRATPTLNGALALDANGDPHIAYVRSGMLVHAYQVDELWAADVVDSVYGPTRVDLPGGDWFSSAPSTSIAISGHDVHIAYLGGRPPLRYARKAGGSWSAETVDERVSDATLYLSLAVDAAGNPNVSYCGYPSCVAGCSLKYASRAAGKWSIELVDATRRRMLSGQQSALVLHDDVPHIIAAATNSGLWSARKNREWSIESIPGTGEGDVSVAFDSSGRARVAWLEIGELRLARQTESGEWLVHVYADSTIDPFWNCVAIDVDGTSATHVVLHTKDGLKYLVHRGERTEGWEVETIDEKALAIAPFYRVCLTLDDLDRPHVCYVRPESSHKALVYAFRP